MLINKGEKEMPASRLTDEQVMEVRSRFADGATQVALATEFGISQNTVSSIVTGRTRASAGGPMSIGAARKLSHEQVIAMRNAAANGEKTPELAARFNVSPAMVLNVTSGKAFADIAGPLTGKAGRNALPLTVSQVGEILEMSANGEKRQVLADRFGVSIHTISAVRGGKTRGVEGGVRDTYSREDVCKMRELYRDGMSQTEIARFFQTVQPVVSVIVLGKQYATYPGPISGPGRRTLTAKQVTSIRVAFAAGARIDDLAANNSTTPAIVRLIITGRTYPHAAGPTQALAKRQQTVGGD